MVDQKPRRSRCAISTALEIIGDRWSLLILRDILFGQGCSFSAFSDAAEGIASNVLAERLARLGEHGLIATAPDPTDGRRKTYRLTDKGWDLVPTILELITWSASHHDTDTPPEVLAAIRADRDGFAAMLRANTAP